MIAHHVPEEMLAGYASGALGEAWALLVATHATLCPTCREAIARYEAVGGVLLEEQAPAEVSADALQAVLSRLDEPTLSSIPVPSDDVLPRPLLHYIGAPDALEWGRVVPGVRAVTLPVRIGEMPVRLFRFTPGYKVPDHTHVGVEMNLVLTGSFTDDAGTYARGDVSVRDADRVHVQRIDPGEECLALVFTEGPLIPRAMLWRFLQRFVGA